MNRKVNKSGEALDRGDTRGYRFLPHSTCTGWAMLQHRIVYIVKILLIIFVTPISSVKMDIRPWGQ